MIAQVAFNEHDAAAERKPVRGTDKTKRRTRRFRRPTAD
jgi:hypothetical protein